MYEFTNYFSFFVKYAQNDKKICLNLLHKVRFLGQVNRYTKSIRTGIEMKKTENRERTEVKWTEFLSRLQLSGLSVRQYGWTGKRGMRAERSAVRHCCPKGIRTM